VSVFRKVCQGELPEKSIFAGLKKECGQWAGLPKLLKIRRLVPERLAVAPARWLGNQSFRPTHDSCFLQKRRERPPSTSSTQINLINLINFINPNQPKSTQINFINRTLAHLHIKKRFWGILLVVFGALYCGSSAVETVEFRNERGQRERYQRLKHNFAKQGLYQRFAPEGHLLEEAHYANDTLEGERKYFYPSGTVESVERYKRGVFDGKYQKYHENGTLQLEQDYVNGTMEGLSLAYYPNGQLRERVTMRDNVENGPFSEYHENGVLSTQGTYAPNAEGEPVKQGELKEYDEQGQLLRTAQCDNGFCRTTWKKDN
jgi:antitoxin component YwqK of YwqJK toxin-antitoxin module